MSDLQLGQLITTDQQRDAIHVAVAPVTAAEKLFPGQEIGLGEDGRATVAGVNKLGIVDPFLKGPVFEGQRFWLWLPPNTVTGMRHHWQHPAFGEAGPNCEPLPSEKEKAKSKEWLEDFAKEFDREDSGWGQRSFTYDDLMALLSRASRDCDEYFMCRGFDTPDRAYFDRAEMWHHYEVVTGDRLTEEQKETVPFSCSC